MKRLVPNYQRVYLNHTDSIKIIIADDHVRVRQAWALILSTYPGIEVLAQCGDGSEVVEAVRLHAPDVVLMDINMEPVNGIEATRVIARSNPSIRVIGVSVHADSYHVSKMMKAGACGYVTKNSSGDEMFAAIHQVMQGQKYICSEIEGLGVNN
ncbi:MAG TPA: response regulator transcription factor [Chitinophagaceae bacterium]|nr:response regulator transcription factor [Chitinophagaceae bacterium]